MKWKTVQSYVADSFVFIFIFFEITQNEECIKRRERTAGIKAVLSSAATYVVVRPPVRRCCHVFYHWYSECSLFGVDTSIITLYKHRDCLAFTRFLCTHWLLRCSRRARALALSRVRDVFSNGAAYLKYYTVPVLYAAATRTDILDYLTGIDSTF